jgi:YbbR domain-containing protein
VKFLLENLGAKLLSVLAALLLWVALVDEPELIETVAVPIEYRNLDASLDLSPDAPSRVQIQVRGPRTRLGEVNPENTNIVLNLGSMRQPSSRIFPITASSLNLPHRVSLVRAMPSQVRVSLERRIVKDMTVTPNFVPSTAYRVLSSEVSPSTVRVVGPESRMKDVETLPTEPIDVAVVDSSKPLRVNVLVGDPELSISGSALVTVKLSIERIP